MTEEFIFREGDTFKADFVYCSSIVEFILQHEVRQLIRHYVVLDVSQWVFK